MSIARKGFFAPEAKEAPVTKSKAQKISFTYGYIQVGQSIVKEISLEDLPEQVWKLNTGQENEFDKKNIPLVAKEIRLATGTTSNLDEREKLIIKELQKLKESVGQASQEFWQRNHAHLTSLFFLKVEINGRKDVYTNVQRDDCLKDFSSLREFIEPKPARSHRR